MKAESAVTNIKYRWVILVVCWLAYIVAYMQRLGIGPLAPFLKEELNLTGAQVGLFMSAAALGYGITAIPAGWLVDRIGVRWLLLIGETLGGIFLAGMFMTTTFAQGLVFMAMAGMGMGCVSPATTKAVIDWFPVKERATAMGFKQTAVNMGGIVTALTLPTVALALGWRYGFLGIGFIAVVIGIVSFLLYKQPERGVKPGSSKPVAITTSRPSVREVLGCRDIWLVMFTAMLMCVVEFSAITYFVLYLEESLLFTVVTAGFFLAILESGGAFGKPLSGLASDRIFRGSRKKVYILMCGVTAAMCMIFSLFPQGVASWLIILVGFILGFVGAGWGGIHLTLLGEFAGKELVGIVTGLGVVVLIIGHIIGPPIFGHIIDTTGSYRIAWQFLTVLAMLGVVLLVFVREGKRRI
ncbi:MFS transporter [Chloroflexota bacterium]